MVLMERMEALKLVTEVEVDMLLEMEVEIELGVVVVLVVESDGAVGTSVVV